MYDYIWAYHGSWSLNLLNCGKNCRRQREPSCWRMLHLLQVVKKWLPQDTKASFFNLQKKYLQICLILLEMAEGSQGGEEFFPGP